MYRGDITSILKRYGRRCVIEPCNSDKTVSVKALLNPILFRTKRYLGNNYKPDGYSDNAHYLYLGEPKINLADFPLGTILRCCGEAYTIKYSALFFDGKNALYCWAVLEKYSGGEQE